MTKNSQTPDLTITRPWQSHTRRGIWKRNGHKKSGLINNPDIPWQGQKTVQENRTTSLSRNWSGLSASWNSLAFVTSPNLRLLMPFVSTCYAPLFRSALGAICL